MNSYFLMFGWTGLAFDWIIHQRVTYAARSMFFDDAQF